MILYFQIMYKYKIQGDGQVGRLEYIKQTPAKTSPPNGIFMQHASVKKGRRIEGCANDAKKEGGLGDYWLLCFSCSRSLSLRTMGT